MINLRSRIFPFLTFVVIASLAAASCGRSGPAASGMNLLVVTLDTTRADAVGLSSGRGDVTPNLDALGRASAAYAKALEIDRDSAQVHSNVGILHLARFDATQDYHLLDRAKLSFDRAIRLDPGLAAAYMGRGSVHLDWGELAPAVRDFKRAIDLDPGLGNAYVNMALALQVQGKYSEALAYLDRFKARFYPLMQPADRNEIEHMYTQIMVLLGKPR